MAEMCPDGGALKLQSSADDHLGPTGLCWAQGDPLLAFGVLLPLGAMLVPCQRLDVVMSPRILSTSQGWSISPGHILLRFLPSARPVVLINPLNATPLWSFPKCNTRSGPGGFCSCLSFPVQAATGLWFTPAHSLCSSHL